MTRSASLRQDAKLLASAIRRPQVEKEATRGNARASPCRGRCMARRAGFLAIRIEAALRLEAEKIAPLSDQDVADLCASFQQAVVELIHDRLRAG